MVIKHGVFTKPATKKWDIEEAKSMVGLKERPEVMANATTSKVGTHGAVRMLLAEAIMDEALVVDAHAARALMHRARTEPKGA